MENENVKTNEKKYGGYTTCQEKPLCFANYDNF